MIFLNSRLMVIWPTLFGLGVVQTPTWVFVSLGWLYVGVCYRR